MQLDGQASCMMMFFELLSGAAEQRCQLCQGETIAVVQLIYGAPCLVG